MLSPKFFQALEGGSGPPSANAELLTVMVTGATKMANGLRCSPARPDTTACPAGSCAAPGAAYGHGAGRQQVAEFGGQIPPGGQPRQHPAAGNDVEDQVWQLGHSPRCSGRPVAPGTGRKVESPDITLTENRGGVGTVIAGSPALTALRELNF